MMTWVNIDLHGLRISFLNTNPPSDNSVSVSVCDSHSGLGI